jgi:ligand-binding SRPBCC domain-containing protein
VSLVLEREQRIGRPRAEVFAFFEDAANLERITPPFLRFRVTTPPPIAMHDGTLIDYRLSLFGIPFGWRTRIETYRPKEEFTDTQLKGPYKRWHHTHTFEDVPGGTLMRDRVEYELPLGPLGSLAHVLFVKYTLARVFDYRFKAIAEMFPDK